MSVSCPHCGRMIAYSLLSEIMTLSRVSTPVTLLYVAVPAPNSSVLSGSAAISMPFTSTLVAGAACASAGAATSEKRATAMMAKTETPQRLTLAGGGYQSHKRGPLVREPHRYEPTERSSRPGVDGETKRLPERWLKAPPSARFAAMSRTTTAEVAGSSILFRKFVAARSLPDRVDQKGAPCS